MLNAINNISYLKKALSMAFVSLCAFLVLPSAAEAQFQQKVPTSKFVSNVIATDPIVSGDVSGIRNGNILNATNNGIYVVPKYTGDGRIIPDDIRTSIYESSQESGIDAYRIAARIETESAWQSNVGSSAGAKGLMQIMPNTWEAYGSGSIYNPHDSIKSGVKVMVATDSMTKNQYESDAAYNWGIGHVNTAKRMYGENWLSSAPAETQKYVINQDKVKNNIIAQNYVNGARVDKGTVSVASTGASAGTSANKATPANNTGEAAAVAPTNTKKVVDNKKYGLKGDESAEYVDLTVAKKDLKDNLEAASKTLNDKYLPWYKGVPNDEYRIMTGSMADKSFLRYFEDKIKEETDPVKKAEIRKDFDNWKKLKLDYEKASNAYKEYNREKDKQGNTKTGVKIDMAKSHENDLASMQITGTIDGEPLEKKEHQKMTNESCRLDDMRKEYQSQCYSCKVVKLLIQTFMKACSTMYDSSKEAGTKILFYGFIIWMVGFALKNVSSLTSLEPSNNINDLLIFLFKVLFAYVCINGGLTTFTTYIINPIMIAGADFGLAIIDSINAFVGKAPQSPIYKYEGVQIVSPLVINKIFEVNRAIDYTVSTNLVVGNAIICHATHAGAWVDNSIDVVATTITIRIPNLFLVIVGASVWFCGFMMTLAVSYYLVDISYKIGFAILVLPIVLGLWPFDLTKDKLMTCVSIVLKSAATFVFLAITVSYGIILIDHAYGGESEGGINALLEAVKNNNSAWISQKFDITGSYFLILLIAYLYAIKLLPQGATGYVNKFFSDNVFGGSSPMHGKLTQMTAMAKQATVGAAKGVAKGSGRLAKRGINVFKDNSGTGGTTMGGNAAKNIGGATKNAGTAMQQAGGALDKGGAAASKAGSSIMAAGKAQSATGIGAIVGVPMIALGAVVKGAGMTAQFAGKTTKAAGKVTKAAGKVTEAAGKATNNIWNKTTRAPKNAAGKGWEKVKSRFKK